MTAPATITRKRPVRHLTKRTENELGGTRYYGLCGASGTTARDYSPNFTRRNSRGEVVQIVTCTKCLGWYVMTSYRVPKAVRAEKG